MKIHVHVHVCNKVWQSLGWSLTSFITMTVFTLIQASKSSSSRTILFDGHSMLWGNPPNGFLYYSALL